MADTRVKNLIVNAIINLQQHPPEMAPEGWFTRAQIATKLETQTGRLNPARVNALEELVQGGRALKRQKPNDARSYPQYKLNSDWRPEDKV